MELDVIAFAAHPDDAELAMGGTIAKFAEAGFKVGIVDLTQGELGSRGTVLTRREEAHKASDILGITIRKNLYLPDGYLTDSMDMVLKAVKEIRLHRPKIIFAPYFNDRHPDHIAASSIIKKAMFFSGVHKIETRENDKLLPVYRPEKMFFYMQTYEFEPTFIVDISSTYQKKKDALGAYGTQFYKPGNTGPETFISKMNFIDYIDARARAFGFHIGKEYGEPFFSEVKLELDIVNYFSNLEI